MRIYEIIDSPKLILTNEEHHFAENHFDKIDIASLKEREYVIAQNLVRKGLYSISKDNTTLIKQGHEAKQTDHQ